MLTVDQRAPFAPGPTVTARLQDLRACPRRFRTRIKATADAELGPQPVTYENRQELEVLLMLTEKRAKQIEEFNQKIWSHADHEPDLAESEHNSDFEDIIHQLLIRLQQRLSAEMRQPPLQPDLTQGPFASESAYLTLDPIGVTL